jgi:hypothetical protein
MLVGRHSESAHRDVRALSVQEGAAPPKRLLLGYRPRKCRSEATLFGVYTRHSCSRKPVRGQARIGGEAASGAAASWSAETRPPSPGSAATARCCPTSDRRIRRSLPPSSSSASAGSTRPRSRSGSTKWSTTRCVSRPGRPSPTRFTALRRTMPALAGSWLPSQRLRAPTRDDLLDVVARGRWRRVSGRSQPTRRTPHLGTT